MRLLTICCVLMSALVVLMSCSDDDSGSSDEARVQAAVDGVNAASDSIVEASCGCYSAATGEDKQQCIAENAVSPVELTDCERIASTCDTDSYEAFMGCQEDGLRAYRDCIATCPSTARREQCGDDLDTQLNSCASHVSTELGDAFSACQQGQTPSCGGSSGGGGGNNDGGGGGCIDRQSFVDHVYGKAWDVYYYAGSGGAVDCKDDAACIREQYLIAPDGSFALHYTVDPDYTDIDDGLQQICVKGTWTLSCNQITFADCRGSDTYTLALTNNGFNLDAKTFDEAAFFADPSDGFNCTSRPCGWD